MLVQRVFMDLKNHRAIESLRNGRSGDDRKFGQLGNFGKCSDAATQLRHGHVAHGPEQAALMVAQ